MAEAAIVDCLMGRLLITSRPVSRFRSSQGLAASLMRTPGSRHERALHVPVAQGGMNVSVAKLIARRGCCPTSLPTDARKHATALAALALGFVLWLATPLAA